MRLYANFVLDCEGLVITAQVVVIICTLLSPGGFVIMFLYIFLLDCEVVVAIAQVAVITVIQERKIYH